MPTVPELKKEAKRRGIPKYYKMRKAQLFEALSRTPEGMKFLEDGEKKKTPTVKELKREMKRRGIPKYYKMRKAQLLEALSRTPEVRNFLEEWGNRNFNGKLSKSDNFWEHESALEGFMKVYRIDGKNDRDYSLFLNRIKQNVFNLIKKQNESIKLKMIFSCEFFQTILLQDKKEFNRGYFRTKTEVVTVSTDIDELFDKTIERFSEMINKYTKTDSGWIFNKVEFLDILISPYSPLEGSSYFELPEKLANKKAIINVKNENDHECFNVTGATYPQDHNPNRLNKKMRDYSKNFDWSDIEFPVSLKHIDKFEKQNNFAINVFGYENNIVYIIRISERRNIPLIRLLLLTENDNNHYCWIKKFNRLCSSQKDYNKHTLHFCNWCLNGFYKENSLQKHIEYCSTNDAIRIELPKKVPN